MGGNASLHWAFYRDVLLIAQTPGEPTSQDWLEYVTCIAAQRFKGALVVGHGSKLSATQRSEVEKILKRNGARLAVVTSSTVSRGIMTALGWLGLPVRAFAPTDVQGALHFLSVPVEDHREAAGIVEGLERGLITQQGRVVKHG